MNCSTALKLTCTGVLSEANLVVFTSEKIHARKISRSLDTKPVERDEWNVTYVYYYSDGATFS